MYCADMDEGLSERDVLDLTKMVNSVEWSYHADHTIYPKEVGSAYVRSELFSGNMGSLSVKLYRRDIEESSEKLPFELHPPHDSVEYIVEVHRPGRSACADGDFVMSLFRGVMLRHSSKG